MKVKKWFDKVKKRICKEANMSGKFGIEITEDMFELRMPKVNSNRINSTEYQNTALRHVAEREEIL